VASGVTAVVSAFSLGLLGGALLVDKANEPRPASVHDTKPTPTVTVTETVTPRPTPKPSRSEKRTAAPTATPKTPREIGKALAAKRGWSAAQWAALEELWQVESGWNPDAQNPSSTAYGIAQFLDSTWALVGAQKTSDPAGQIEAGLTYIARTYGLPTNALAAWQGRSPHWY
jgi:hypothetical protein